MNELNVTFAQYIADDVSNENTNIKAVIGDKTLFLPLDPNNRHYAEILRQVEAGTLTIQPADTED